MSGFPLTGFVHNHKLFLKPLISCFYSTSHNSLMPCGTGSLESQVHYKVCRHYTCVKWRHSCLPNSGPRGGLVVKRMTPSAVAWLCSVVFPGYESELPSKDTAHGKRLRSRIGAEVHFTREMIFAIKKDCFLANQSNNQRLNTQPGIAVHFKGSSTDILL